LKLLKSFISVIIILALVIFLVENYQAFSTTVELKVDLFSLHYHSPKIFILYIAGISFFLGVFITCLYVIKERFQMKRQIKNLINISKEKDKELTSLRNLPITSDNVGSFK
jgi:uncharacterized integral membrane protein